jgi:hypothetical protein
MLNAAVFGELNQRAADGRVVGQRFDLVVLKSVGERLTGLRNS